MQQILQHLINIFQSYGVLGLIVLSFAESSFFPIPPDVILIPMCLMDKSMSLLYALFTTLSSVVGGIFGYYIGKRLGKPILRKFFKEDKIEKVGYYFDKYGGWSIVIAGFTPIPYKIFTIAAGVFNINFFTFVTASLIGRGMRFFLEGILIFYMGDGAKYFISNYFEYITIGVALVLILFYTLFKYLNKKNLLKLNFAVYKKKIYARLNSFHKKYRIVDQTAFYVYTSIVLSFFSLFVFWELTEENFIHKDYTFDMYILHLVLSIRNNVLTKIFKAVTVLGDYQFIIAFTALSVLLMIKNKQKRFASFFALNITLVWLFNELLKVLFKRPRPDLIYRLIEAKGYSYPSGHAMVSLTFALVFVYYLNEMEFKNNFIKWIVVMLALIIGISRIYLGVHYFTDVLAGWAVAVIYSTTSILIYKNVLIKVR
ncbi:phosphatase PAP2 family protein [Caloramator sp. ALD01]|uniref:phosphatase PAP2 family protein n=1 Tax=Caloramator sp. ALD01 TaxID=1031288 RepID=UPI0018DCE38F|nr:phosphatase PAP2 family protein [Caloramator sp. ALD01]